MQIKDEIIIDQCISMLHNPLVTHNPTPQEQMKTETISEAFTDEIQRAHIAELQKQNTELLASNEELVSLVKTIPALLTSARLDVREGKQTVYDYVRHNRALRNH